MNTLIADGLKVVARLLLSVAHRIDHPTIAVYDSNWQPIGVARAVPGLRGGLMLEGDTSPSALFWDVRNRGD